DAAAIEAAVTTDVLPMDVQRLLLPTQADTQPRPRLAAHGNYVFGVLVLPTSDTDDGSVTCHEIDVVATLDRLVTVRKTPPSLETCDISELVTTANRDDLPAGMCLYQLIDEIAER